MIAGATRRIFHLRSPAADLDLGFARHLFLALAHIIEVLVFVVLGLFNLWRSTKSLSRPAPRDGHDFLANALVIGVTAPTMSEGVFWASGYRPLPSQ
jgi:hypothetical protein